LKGNAAVDLLPDQRESPVLTGNKRRIEPPPQLTEQVDNQARFNKKWNVPIFIGSGQLTSTEKKKKRDGVEVVSPLHRVLGWAPFTFKS